MALATSSAKYHPYRLSRKARMASSAQPVARLTASITSIQASCGSAYCRIVPKNPRISFALGRIVEDPFCIVGLPSR
jgi:hypothetical protein